MSTLTAGFLEGPNGKLHVSIFCAKNNHYPRRWVIHVPAFAEEMNKCRPMVSRQARRLVDEGVVVVVPDLTGTGDSEGEFNVATWEAWKNDLKYLLAWAQDQGANDVTLWGMRLGCLLASEVARDQGRGLVTGLLFWQPVHSGKQHMTQFLRLRMAAALMKGDSETVAQLRERLLQGQSIEIAGYLLGPDLFGQIDNTVMADLALPQGLNVEILEVVSSESKGLLPVTQNLVERWQALGLNCSATTVQGDPFWMTQEIAFAPSLIEETAGRLPRSDVGPNRDSPATGKSGSSPGLDMGLISGRVNEESIVFPCEEAELAGILHRPEQSSKTGVLVVVGGPQYRVGSHRQFVQLARYLCDQGIPVFRFDYRGMGDSSGELLGFQSVDTDIHCAIDAFQHHYTAVTDIVIWGLCDAATAAISYAPGDYRVKGLVLVNPWVYSKQGAAKAYLKHYYLARLFSGAFWKKVLRGEFNPLQSASSALEIAGSALDAVPDDPLGENQNLQPASSPIEESGDLPTQFTHNLQNFSGEVLLVLSGNDLTAAEFKDVVKSNRKLRKLLDSSVVRMEVLQGADHTFSTADWRIKVEQISVDWLGSLPSSDRSAIRRA